MSLNSILIAVFIGLINISFAQNKSSIPITSRSNDAIEIYHKAKALEGLLKTEEAKNFYLKALAIDSTFAMAHIALAMIKDNYEIRKHHVGQAMTYINGVSEGEKLWILGRNNFYGSQDGKSEYECFKQLVSLYPEDENANYLFGYVNIHHGMKAPDSAIHYFKKALKINPKVSQYYNELAYAYMANRDFKNAEETIQNYISFLPNHENPRDTYAEMLMRDHRYEASLKSYDEVLNINPNAPWAFMGKAANLNFLMRFKEARDILKNLDSIPLSDYEYRHKWRSRVCNYLLEGRFDAAITILNNQRLESVSGANQREPLFHQYMAFSRMTRLYFESGQSNKGLECYNLWLTFVNANITRQSTIDNVLQLNDYYKAYHHFLNGQYKTAKVILDKMENPSGDCRLLHAKILLAEGSTRSAIVILERLDDENPYYLYWLSKAYAMEESHEKYKNILKRINSLIEMNNLDYALAIFLRNK